MIGTLFGASVRRWLAVPLLVVVSALSACSGDDTSDDGGSGGPSASGDASKEVAAKALDDRFEPAVLTVPVGGTVAWTNEGRNKHNVTEVVPDGATPLAFGKRTGEFDPQASYRFTFTRAGTYEYYCSLHGTAATGMRATVVVGDGGPPTSANAATTTAPAGSVTIKTIIVPTDAATIQAAVDQANPGDLVLVQPGVYREAVTVSRPNIVIRGADRAQTILDGEFTRENGFKVVANGVAIENMTARNFTTNGFYWTGVTGYRASYLTASRNGDYGVYAFNSTKGLFEHSYASGSPDSGFYIGQCHPCDAVVDDVIAEHNGLGYSGTNAGGNLLIINSVWRQNWAGIVPNSLDSEANPPQRDATIVGNIISDNNAQGPAKEFALLAYGSGIVVAGGQGNIIERNRIFDHVGAGIAIVPFGDKNTYPAQRNQVRGNAVEASQIFDLGLVESAGDANCFQGNQFTSSAPKQIQQVAPCGGAPTASSVDPPNLGALIAREKPTPMDYRQAPEPGSQPNMPNASSAPARPATDVPPRVDLSLVKLPARPTA